jgi:hypothetical protein
MVCLLSSINLDESIIILKLCFQFMELGSRYSYPLSNTSRREVYEIMLRSTAISWPAGLYINGEHAQVHSGGLGLKLSILRSCNTSL